MQLLAAIKSLFYEPHRRKHGVKPDARQKYRLYREIIMTATALTCWAPPAESQGKNAETCRGIQDNAARLRCLEQLVPASPTGTAANDINGWRLVKTRDPRGGPDAVSVTRPADGARSDLNFAGLMLRCPTAGADVEVALALLEPLPPRTRPNVALHDGQSDIQVAASVIAPGLLLLLPPEITVLVKGSWQKQRQLSVSIRSDGTTTAGVVALDGLGAAYQALVANCPPQH
jgi:hypothetical protein